MSKRFLLVLLVIIAGFVGISMFGRDKADAPSGSSSVQPTNHVSGNSPKNIVLLEYGDYQCPACAAYHPILKDLTEKYKDQIVFQFRNYPLVQVHLNAHASSRAAEAADKQGKFWEMHDKLYETQDNWSQTSNAKTYFEEYARELGLDVAKFSTDYASSEVNDLIAADLKAGQELGVDSTPTFILDGKKIESPRDQTSFDKVIADAIAAKQ